MEWRLKRGDRTFVATIVPAAEVSRPGGRLGTENAWSVGNVTVQASGAGFRATRDDSSGVLTIHGDSLIVIVRPSSRRP
jgi:hypothetical protein